MRDASEHGDPGEAQPQERGIGCITRGELAVEAVQLERHTALQAAGLTISDRRRRMLLPIADGCRDTDALWRRPRASVYCHRKTGGVHDMQRPADWNEVSDARHDRVALSLQQHRHVSSRTPLCRDECRYLREVREHTVHDAKGAWYKAVQVAKLEQHGYGWYVYSI